jgi:hypothetical protein
MENKKITKRKRKKKKKKKKDKLFWSSGESNAGPPLC